MRQTEQNFTIRAEEQKDFRAVENLTREAFWNVYRPGCSEHYVLHCYRNNPDFIPQLSLVMEKDGTIIAHVMFSKAARGRSPILFGARTGPGLAQTKQRGRSHIRAAGRLLCGGTKPRRF